jgi:hypothetical protein
MPTIDPMLTLRLPGFSGLVVRMYPVLVRNLVESFVHVGIACLAVRNVAAAVVDAAQISARLGVGHTPVASVASVVAVVPWWPWSPWWRVA